MYENTLSKAGLSPDQARIYEVLLKNGPLPAGEVSKKAELKRGLTYKVLDELVVLGLAKKNEKGKVLRFEPAHPLQLKELAERKEQEAKVAQEALGGILSNLTSDFNLISGRPGVQYFEGKEAVARIAEDSLTAEGAIYSYIDNDALDKYIPKENERYVRERIKRGIVKKIISIDTSHTRAIAKDFSSQLLECRVIKSNLPFATVMQIYGNKVSYLTLDERVKVGMIIDNPFIAKMHRVLFEQLWDVAQSITPPIGQLPSAGEVGEA